MNDPKRKQHNEFIKEVKKVADYNLVTKTKDPDKLIYCYLCDKNVRYNNVKFHLKTFKHIEFNPLKSY